MGKNKQKTASHKYKSNKKQDNRTYKNNRMIYFYMARSALNKIRQKRTKAIIGRLNPIYDRVNQSGSGMGSDLLKAGLDLGSKALGSELGKRLINKDNIPNLLKFGASKVKNKNVKKALESEIADMVVNEAQGRARKKYNSTNLFG